MEEFVVGSEDGEDKFWLSIYLKTSKLRYSTKYPYGSLLQEVTFWGEIAE